MRFAVATLTETINLRYLLVKWLT